MFIVVVKKRRKKQIIFPRKSTYIFFAKHKSETLFKVQKWNQIKRCAGRELFFGHFFFTYISHTHISLCFKSALNSQCYVPYLLG